MFSRMPKIGPLFLKKSVQRKSDSQMQGDQYIIGALNINATIRAYQVHPFLKVRKHALYVYSFFVHILTFILFVQGTWPPYSRHRSVGHTKSGVGEAAGHRELATGDCGATASQGYDGSGHGQGISSRLPNRYRWREKEFTIARDTDETQQNLLRSSGSGIHVHSRSQYGTRVQIM